MKETKRPKAMCGLTLKLTSNFGQWETLLAILISPICCRSGTGRWREARASTTWAASPTRAPAAAAPCPAPPEVRPRPPSWCRTRPRPSRPRLTETETENSGLGPTHCTCLLWRTAWVQRLTLVTVTLLTSSGVRASLRLRWWTRAARAQVFCQPHVVLSNIFCNCTWALTFGNNFPTSLFTKHKP